MKTTRRFKAGFGLLFIVLGFATAPPALAAAGDARWCPLLGSAYNDPGCVMAASFQDAVNKAKADGRPGNIFAMGLTSFTENVVAKNLTGVAIIGNPDSVGAPTLNGSLTISGGRVIVVGGLTVTGGIKIEKAKGGHQILFNTANIDVTGGKFTSGTVTDSTSSLTLAEGLLIYNNVGNVTLSKVSAAKATSYGGAVVSPGSGSVTISQSKFSKNGATGLLVDALGTITLSDISSLQNAASGAELSAGGAASLIISAKKGKGNHFDRNTGAGLLASVTGSGALIAADLNASKNGQYGAQLSTSGGPLTVVAAKSRANRFDGNAQFGLLANAVGALSAADLSASKNGQFGAQLNNTGLSNNLVLGSVKSKRNTFDRNALHGLTVTSQGNVSLLNVGASKNVGYGAQIATASGSVELIASKGRNTFDRNGQQGLMISGSAGVLVQDISASKNGQTGAMINSPAGLVVVAAVKTRLNNFDQNGLHGLSTASATGQTLSDLSASKNGAIGVLVSNGAGLATIKTVRSKQNQFSRNMTNGVAIGSTGGIDIHNTTASMNGAGGSFAGFSLSTSNTNATLTCSTAKNNTGNGIKATLGTGTLYLKTFIASGNSTDINLVGSGPNLSTVSCPS